MAPNVPRLLSSLLAGLLSGAVVNAQVEWTIHTPVNLAMSVKNVREGPSTCPLTFAEAKENLKTWSPIAADVGGNIVVAGNANTDGNLVEKFYLVNGLATGFTDTSAITRIQVDPTVTDDELCWALKETDTVLRSCGYDADSNSQQLFRVNLGAPAGATSSLVSVRSDPTDLSRYDPLQPPADTSSPLQFGGSDGRTVCIYADVIGNNANTVLTSPTAGRKANYPGASFRSIALARTPGLSSPRAISTTPGCVMADGLLNYESVDCVIGAAYNAVNTSCYQTRAADTECVLKFVGPFCVDLVDTRAAAGPPLLASEIEETLEKCARSVSLGPCRANPTGRACSSGLFAAIDDGTAGPDDPNQKMFPADPELELSPGAVDFLVGLVKSHFTSTDDALRFLALDGVENSAILCDALAGFIKSTPLSNQCARLWSLPVADIVPETDYKTAAAKAGAVVGSLIEALRQVPDAATAAQLASPTTWLSLTSLFKVVASGQGVVLRATGDVTGSSVEIGRLTGPGIVVPFTTANQSMGALKAAGQYGFRHCESIAPGPKLRLACPAFSTADSTAQWAEQTDPDDQPPVPDVLTTVGDLNPDQLTTLSNLNEAWTSFARNANETITPPWADLLSFLSPEDFYSWVALDGNYAAHFQISAAESQAVKEWGRRFDVAQLDQLKSGFAKIDNFDFIVTRRTYLSEETLVMLLNQTTGKSPDGKPGIYDVSDLVDNANSDRLGRDKSGEVPHSVMVTRPGLLPYAPSTKFFKGTPYTFVIQSKFGKYISPLLQDVDYIAFLNGDQGKFKLLGWAGTNSANPSVFYFDNVV